MLTDMRKSSTDPLLKQNGVAGQHGLAMGRGGAERGPNMPETLRRNLQMWCPSSSRHLQCLLF